MKHPFNNYLNMRNSKINEMFEMPSRMNSLANNLIRMSNQVKHSSSNLNTSSRKPINNYSMYSYSSFSDGKKAKGFESKIVGNQNKAVLTQRNLPNGKVTVKQISPRNLNLHNVIMEF